MMLHWLSNIIIMSLPLVPTLCVGAGAATLRVDWAGMRGI